MVSREELVIDGIEQLETPVPGWWKKTFITLLSLCPFYLLYYHIGAPGRSMADAYDQALARNTRLQFEEIGELKPDAETILRFTEKANWLKVGKVVFKTNCASCHGRSGEGAVGPNLTDDRYKNIRSVEDIARVVLQGANNKAMPAWDGKLHPNEVVLVSAYVASIRGTNVAGGKAAEGGAIPAWPDVPAEPEKAAEGQDDPTS